MHFSFFSFIYLLNSFLFSLFMFHFFFFTSLSFHSSYPCFFASFTLLTQLGYSFILYLPFFSPLFVSHTYSLILHPFSLPLPFFFASLILLTPHFFIYFLFIFLFLFPPSFSSFLHSLTHLSILYLFLSLSFHLSIFYFTHSFCVTVKYSCTLANYETPKPCESHLETFLSGTFRYASCIMSQRLLIL